MQRLEVSGVVRHVYMYMPYRTANLLTLHFYTFVQQISILNILNMLHNLSFFSPSKCNLFYNATKFGVRIIHILNTGCVKI
jgi:hypothetical protein